MNPQEKAQCVEWFIETKSDTQVQRKFRRSYNRTPPSRPSIRAWYKKFKETGSIEHKKGAGRPRTSIENVERIREIFLRSPRKSTRAAARELQLPHSTVHQVIQKRLKLHPYVKDKPSDSSDTQGSSTNPTPGSSSSSSGMNSAESAPPHQPKKGEGTRDKS